MIVENTLQTPVDSTPAIAADGKPKTDKSAEEPFMRHRLRDSIPFWKSVGACDMVMQLPHMYTYVMRLEAIL